MLFQEFERTLKKQISEAVSIFTMEDGSRYIATPFVYGDGDGPVIALKQHGAGWMLSDEGNTMMRLSWQLAEGAVETRECQEKIADALAVSQAVEKNGRIFLPLKGPNYSDAVFDFVHTLLLMDELSNFEEFSLSANAAQSQMPMKAFKSKFKDIIRASLPLDRVAFNWNDPRWDTEGIYTVDCMVNGMASPLFLHAPGNDNQARDAAITAYRFNKMSVDGKHAAVFRDESRLNPKAVSRLQDVCETTFDNIERDEENIRKFLSALR